MNVSGHEGKRAKRRRSSGRGGRKRVRLNDGRAQYVDFDQQLLPDHSSASAATTPSDDSGFHDFQSQSGSSLRSFSSHVSFTYPSEAELQKLSESIWDHYAKMKQDEESFKRKMRLRADLCDVMRDVFGPDCNLVAVGSSITGMGSYNSDIDMCLTVFEHHAGFGYETDRAYALRCLRMARKALAKLRAIAHLELVPARVPILRLSTRDGLEADINCNNTIGIRNSHLLHYYSKMDERFPALMLVLKHWAIREGVLDAMNGLLNSYSLTLLLLHFLQCGVAPPVLPNLQALFPAVFDCRNDISNLRVFEELPVWLGKGANKQSIGALLIGFFDYFANNFNFERHAISIADACRFDRRRLDPNTDRYFIYVAEPFDGETTARSVQAPENFVKIKKAFDDSLQKLAFFANLDGIGVQFT